MLSKRIGFWLCLLFVAGVSATFCVSAEEDPFAVRAYDEIHTHGGVIYKGRILSENKDSVRIRILRSKTVIPVPRSKIKRIKRRATPEQKVEEVLKSSGGSPRQMAFNARKALKRFKGNRRVTEMVLKTLESKARSGDSALLALLVELYLEAGDPFKAESTAKTLVQKSDSATARLLLGRSLADQGKTEEALKQLEKAKAMAPDKEDVLVLLAELLLSVGEPEKANKVFADALAKNPRQVGALIGQANVRLRQGQIEEAAKSFESALSISDSNFDAKIGLAACKLMRQGFDEAIQLADSVLSRDVSNAGAYAIQGYAHLLKGNADQPEKALEKIEESLREDPGNLRVKVHRAVAMNRQAEILDLNDKPDEANMKRQEAAKILRDVEAANSNDSWLQYFMAERRWVQAEIESDPARSQIALDLAAKGFQKAARLSPAYAPAHQAVGAVALKMRKWEEAEQAYGEAIKRDGKTAEYHAGKGLALLGKKRLQAALLTFRKAKELDPKNVAALCGLGYIYNFEKNESAAKGFFEQALAADGRCAYAAAALKMIYAQRNLSLQYLPFNDGDPPGWRGSKGRKVRARVEDGKVRWRGAMGGAASRNLEYVTNLTANTFVRIDADIEVARDMPASLVLRLASRKGSAVNFYIEFGKDETGRLSYRYKDYSGVPPDWRMVQPWPKSGKLRLGIEAPDLRSGMVNLYVNGTEKGALQLQFKRPTKITAGLALSSPARESVEAAGDNISLLTRASTSESTRTRPGELIPPSEQKEKP